MNCPICRADLPDDAVFCVKCGTRVDGAGNHAHAKTIANRRSEAFELGFIITSHAMSFISKWPACKDVMDLLQKWNMQCCSFEISSADDVARFLNDFLEKFGTTYGKSFKDSFYLGSCFAFGAVHVTGGEVHTWGEWGLKVKMQCVKLGLPMALIDKISDQISQDDLMLLKVQLAVALDEHERDILE